MATLINLPADPRDRALREALLGAAGDVAQGLERRRGRKQDTAFNEQLALLLSGGGAPTQEPPLNVGGGTGPALPPTSGVDLSGVRPEQAGVLAQVMSGLGVGAFGARERQQEERGRSRARFESGLKREETEVEVSARGKEEARLAKAQLDAVLGPVDPTTGLHQRVALELGKLKQDTRTAELGAPQDVIVFPAGMQPSVDNLGKAGVRRVPGARPGEVELGEGEQAVSSESLVREAGAAAALQEAKNRLSKIKSADAARQMALGLLRNANNLDPVERVQLAALYGITDPSGAAAFNAALEGLPGPQQAQRAADIAKIKSRLKRGDALAVARMLEEFSAHIASATSDDEKIQRTRQVQENLIAAAPDRPELWTLGGRLEQIYANLPPGVGTEEAEGAAQVVIRQGALDALRELGVRPETSRF